MDSLGIVTTTRPPWNEGYRWGFASAVRQPMSARITRVITSKGEGGEVAAGTLISVALKDVQESDNEFRAKLRPGLAQADKNHVLFFSPKNSFHSVMSFAWNCLLSSGPALEGSLFRVWEGCFSGGAHSAEPH